MATHTDVAFAVTLKLDKIIRRTLAMAAEGAECLDIMDAMFKEERDGWKLYHDPSAVWYIHDTDDAAPVPVLHALLVDLASEDETRYEISYFRLHKELEFENMADHDGEFEEPFGLGYTLKLEYDPKPAPAPTPTPPPTPPPPPTEMKPCPPTRKPRAKARAKPKAAPKRHTRRR